MKSKREFDKDFNKAVKKHAKEDANFIALSRKVKLKCACGLSAEFWCNSPVLISAVKAEWYLRHSSAGCEMKIEEVID
jgi:hypothetical protein